MKNNISQDELAMWGCRYWWVAMATKIREALPCVNK